MAERQEFQDIATDTEFQNLLATQAAVGQIASNPKTQAILNNQEIIQQIEQTDLKDLRQYLNTGESPKYVDTRILGRWQLDPYATLLQMKRHRAGITTAEMRLLKQQLEFIKSYSLVVTPDNAVRLKGPDVMQLMEKYLGEMARAFAEGHRRASPPRTVAAAPAPQAPAASTPGQSAEMRRRYGLGPAATPAPTPAPAPIYAVPVAAPATSPPPTPAAIAAEIAALPIIVLAQGTWKGEGSRYELSMQAQAGGFKFDSGGKSANVEAEVRDARLYLTEGKSTTVLVKF
jgi:hypothetical protein